MKVTAADRDWALLVKNRDNWTCRRCHKFFPEGQQRRGLHTHHIFTRGRKSTRIDVENGVSLCYGHHRWAHSNPLEFHEWMRDELGVEVYEALQARSRVMKRTGT